MLLFWIALAVLVPTFALLGVLVTRQEWDYEDADNELTSTQQQRGQQMGIRDRLEHRRKIKLVERAIRTSFGGRLTNSQIRHFVLNGEQVPDFSTDARGRITLL